MRPGTRLAGEFSEASIRALRAGFSLGWKRLPPRTLGLTAVFGAALAVMVGAVERRAGSLGAVDRSLTGTFGLVIPLVTFTVVFRGSGQTNLGDGLWTLARYGLSRRVLAMGTVVTLTLASSSLAALFGILAVVSAGGHSLAELSGDALTSAWIGALTSAAYVGWFATFATFGRRGGARIVPLLADYATSGSTFAFAAVFPRMHAVNLLGGPSPMSASQSSSAIFLAASAVTLDLIASARCGR
jgi:hypothetical protein